MWYLLCLPVLITFSISTTLFTVCEAFSPGSSCYLDSLSSVSSAADANHQDNFPFDSSHDEHEITIPIPPEEEYYGLTNPMANCWAGSKHEQYGGYLRNLNLSTETRRTTTTTATAATSSSKTDEWYGKCRPMASWEGYSHPKWGGYLNSLSKATKVVMEEEEITNEDMEKGDGT